ncbi:MAG: primosomal protein N' [Phycisphaerales bacterium]|nr:primosomal protein N' [Phycisphaerales bacterium]
MVKPRAHAESEFLWIESGELKTGTVVTVAPIAPVDRLYSYVLPPALAGRIEPGQRIRVPIGKRGRLADGFCVSVDQRSWDATLKPVHSLIDDRSFLTADLLELGSWLARYYCCPLGRTLAALVPETVRRQAGFRRVTLVRRTDQPNDPTHKLGAKQRAILDRLQSGDTPADTVALLRECDASTTTLRSLVRRGLLATETHRLPADAPSIDVPPVEPTFALNDAQRAAVEQVHGMIDARGFRVAYLFGVSGSGKTEVYIHAIRRVLAAGKQAVFLVPEIALTTQLVSRLAARFPDVAVIHSGLTGVQRSLTWSAIHDQRRRVVIGTRSAVFAPCPALGLIVVDEEQEPSYKNLRAPRYHVRDVAIKRAQQLGIPVLLGSATPSLESWHNCIRHSHFVRIDLPRRVRDLPMPELHIVDMNGEYKETTGVPDLSHQLVRALHRTFDRREQAILLINRRGYATWIGCPRCRHRIRCTHCDVNVVYHSARRELLCHYCGRRAPAPTQCPNPSCGGKLVHVGVGSQRIEELLRKLFPNARLARADSDTMRHPDAYRQLIADVESRAIDCVVGTQMIAKGLDFPFVSLVGVIGADTTLAGADFRSSERLFQLVTQVAGRAGRADAPGHVIIQTLAPDHPALSAAAHGDFAKFADDELELRQRTALPPFTRLTRFVVADPIAPRAQAAARELTANIQSVIPTASPPTADTLGPMPCSLTRLRGQYRFETILRTASAATMSAFLDELRGRRLLRVKAKSIVVDVDPVSMT